MFEKQTQIHIMIYTFLLILILIMPYKNFGAYLLLAVGIYAMFVLKSITNDIKTLKNPVGSKILSIVLFSLIIYLGTMLFYGLSNIGTGDGAGFYIIAMLYVILGIISIIINITRITKNKQITQPKIINPLLWIILVVIAIILFYNPIVGRIALASNNPYVCFTQVVFKEDSFAFQKSFTDSCLAKVIVNLGDETKCAMIGDTYEYHFQTVCYYQIAIKKQDSSICSNINNENGMREICINAVKRIMQDQD